jgi:hypothetical protein
MNAGARRPDNSDVGKSTSISRDDIRDGAVPSPGRRRVLIASNLAGDCVRNLVGEDLGAIEEIMPDIESGRIAYAVLSFGGFLGIENEAYYQRKTSGKSGRKSTS